VAGRVSPPRGRSATVRESRRSAWRPALDAVTEEGVVAFLPAHFPERFPWLTEAVRSAQSADRILVVATYPEPLSAARWHRVKWVHDASLATPGSKYREAVRRIGPGEILAPLDDDDLWLPEKVPSVRRVLFGPGERVDYFAHAAATLRDGAPSGILGPREANGSMTALRRSVLTSARVRPFFERLEWGCEPFLRYAALAAQVRIETTEAVLAHVRYHDANSSHPPVGYRRFTEWQRATSERYLAGWKLIDEMTRRIPNRPPEIDEKISEFTRLVELSVIGRSANYLFSPK
jgi:hypothetical protein